LQPTVPETANRDVFDRGATFLEVALAATNFLAKGEIREDVELTKTAAGAVARPFLCFIVDPGILFGGGKIFSVSVSNLDFYASCARETHKNAASIVHCCTAVLAWGGH
jgi:hypothetical protein